MYLLKRPEKQLLHNREQKDHINTCLRGRNMVSPKTPLPAQRPTIGRESYKAKPQAYTKGNEEEPKHNTVEGYQTQR